MKPPLGKKKTPHRLVEDPTAPMGIPLRPDLAEAVGRKSGRPPRRNRAVEHHQQVALFQNAAAWAPRHPELRLLFAVPNGVRTSPAQAGKLKAEGLRSGVPDVVLPVARPGELEALDDVGAASEVFRGYTAPYPGLPNRIEFHGLFLEMKAVYPDVDPRQPDKATVVRGAAKPAQKEWARALMGQGYAVAFAWGPEAAFRVLLDYCSGRYVQRAEPWKREGGRG